MMKKNFRDSNDSSNLKSFSSDETSMPNPFSLPLWKSLGGESHEDSEIFSDIVLSYINQILMEEDGDQKVDMLQEHPALLAAEKGFLDILCETQSSSSSSSSSDHRTPTSNRSCYNSSDDSLSPQGTDLNVSDVLGDGTGLRSWHYNLGIEQLSHFLPNHHKLTSASSPATTSTTRKNAHFSDDDLEAEQGRTFKHSALYLDSDVPPEMFDFLLHKDCKQEKPVEANCNSNANRKSRRKKRLEKTDSVDLNFLLLQCAEAVSNNELHRANGLLIQIRQSSSPFGDAEQRIAHYFANGLEARLAGGTGSKNYYYPPTLPSMTDRLKAHQIYVAASPFKKISDFFAHQTILNASEKAAKLHIIDLGIYHGFMWPCFMQRLSTLPGGSPRLRITGVDVPQPGFRPAERIEETGRRLTDYARQFKVPFEYHAIACNWENLQPEDLSIEPDEVLAVNCMYRLRNLADETVSPDSPRDQVLRTIRRLNPKVFVLGVVNGTYNAPFFVTRFKEALFHFSALFDMLETNVEREDEHRRLLEKHCFEREILNVVSCEGLERVERPEPYKQWRLRSERAGLEQMPLDSGIVSKAKEKVKKCYHKDFVVDEDGKWLLQGWKGRILSALSAWKARDA
ncbi:hypothetical protein M5K25_006384 [Dendrobium thyrsiflorum]|uniref:Scarecrow-like protein 9 n=1 Tax=Dendrobium thyrsiflorum TaxID=117978 RepID=A0ABD0VI69_DENTH